MPEVAAGRVGGSHRQRLPRTVRTCIRILVKQANARRQSRSWRLLHVGRVVAVLPPAVGGYGLIPRGRHRAIERNQERIVDHIDPISPDLGHGETFLIDSPIRVVADDLSLLNRRHLVIPQHGGVGGGGIGRCSGGCS